jgi:pimeloyl-ACP methyl ester carboxylesterase/DNA-binding CsgD family transcriptional regulator
MNAPVARYTKTTDGYSIAYMVSGKGPPIVFLPEIFQHSQLAWTERPIASALRYLSRRFEVVQYDSRGQGMSQRGLVDHTMERYEHDLGAIIEAIGHCSVALFASSIFGHVAARYAVEHPDRVAALILSHVALDHGQGQFVYMPWVVDLAKSDWPGHLLLTARATFPESDPAAMVAYYTAAAEQADHLQFLAVTEKSSLKAVAPNLNVPTLVLTSGADPTWPGSEDRGKLLAPLIPGARLVVVSQRASMTDTLARAEQTESFLDEIGYVMPLLSAESGLSSRELEVLKLLADGRTNPQIAAELVISVNTVQHHVSSILAKTGLANRTEVAAFAVRQGFNS